MSSATYRVVSLRATNRDSVSRETVHRITADEVHEVVQPLFMESYRPADGSLNEWQPSCDELTTGDLVFQVHYGDVLGVELVFTSGPLRSAVYRVPGLERQVHRLPAPR